ncbi:methionine/alanine import family NSS transporter small subunit [Streptomyces boninensis]
MSGSAIVMLIVAIVIVWGGLVGALLKLRSHPDPLE